MTEKSVAGKRKKAVTFSSIEKENRAEYSRRARMTAAGRFAEFAAIQERAFGRAWTGTPIVKVATCEVLDWYR